MSGEGDGLSYKLIIRPNGLGRFVYEGFYGLLPFREAPFPLSDLRTYGSGRGWNKFFLKTPVICLPNRRIFGIIETLDQSAPALVGMPWGCSSTGRALEWHSRGKGFDPPHLHQTRHIRTLCVYVRKRNRFVGFFFIFALYALPLILGYKG